ncbi:hypothetical protein [Gaopeijia maritima]|uniref:6-bladed beta-propeller n=1 Tax=Gaopeijia maritima TaxID=3119007 RepID=A0ABU9E8N1_9BACT
MAGSRLRRSPSSSRVGALAFFALSFVSCGERSAPERTAGNSDGAGHTEAPGALRFDSSGVEIVVSRNVVALEDVGWRISSRPSVVIGAANTSSGELYRVSGAKVSTSDDHVLIADGGRRQVVAFDFGGYERRSFGGRGRGPGEFEEIALVPAPGSDSLVAWDSRLRRLHLVSEDLGDARTLVPEGRPPARPPLGFTGGHLLVENMLITPFKDGANAFPQVFSWFEPESGRKVDILSVSLETMYSVSPRGGGPRTSGVIPFVPRPAAAVGIGEAFFIRDEKPEVAVIDLAGRTQRILRVPGYEGPEVTDEMVAEHRRHEYGDSWNSAVVDQLYEAMTPPSRAPAFDAVVFDLTGRVWVRTVPVEVEPADSGGGGIPWLVFDESGEVLGQILIPSGLEVTEIGESHVLGVVVDDFGVERVVSYDLERAGEASP